MIQTTRPTPLDNFHSDELRAELARRDAITEDAVQLYKDLTPTTQKPERFMAQQRGFDAFSSNDANPYPEGTAEYVLWMNGWNIAFMLDKRSAENV